MQSQHLYESKRDKILAILHDSNLTVEQKFDKLNIIELLQDSDIYQAELVAQNQELLEKESQLLTSKSEFEALFNLAPIGYFRLDHNYNILQFNQIAISLCQGISLHFYKNKPFTLLCDSSSSVNFINIQKIVEQEGYANGVIMHNHPNRSIVRLDIREHKNEYFLSLVDITLERKQEAMLLVQSKNAAMGEMVSMITHQWKQPLSVISVLNTTMDLQLENDFFDKEAFLHNNTLIKEQIDFMSQTIDDFKEYFDENKQRHIQNVKNCVARAIKFTAPALFKHEIKLSVEYLDDGDYEIYSFTHDVCQVLMNIINNAKDEFARLGDDRERYIKLSIFHETQQQRECIAISILNNGGMIPEDHLESIFQSDFSTKKEIGGSGIGLYIVDKIVKEHIDGAISVENIPQIDGVRFTLRVPLIKKG